jgi:hypothetical protein
MIAITRKMGLRGAVAVALLSAACGGGGGDSSPTGPSIVMSTPPAVSAGVATSTSGCAVTYVCPNADINGNANPSTPTIERLTVENGTSSSCRADLLRNPSSPTVPIEFTIRNPDSSSINSHFWTGDGDMGILPGSGPSTSPGPFRVMGSFSNLQGQRLGDGTTISQTLTIAIKRSGGSGTQFQSVAACSVSVWGHVIPGR